MESSAGSETGSIGCDVRHSKEAAKSWVAGGAADSRHAGSATRVGRRAGAATRPEVSCGAAVRDPAGSSPQAAAPRVLIAIEDKYRTYREVMGEILRSTRPRLEVGVVSSSDLRAELRRFGPQIVVHAGNDSRPLALLGRAFAGAEPSVGVANRQG